MIDAIYFQITDHGQQITLYFYLIMIKLIIFDIDGTLVDAYDSIHEALQRTLADLDYPQTTYEQSKRAVGRGVEALLGSFVDEAHVPQALALYTQHTDDVLKDTVKFLPGAEKLVRNLFAQGYKLAIASNRPHQFSKRILQYLNVDECFHAVVCADNVANAKPEPDMIQAILEHFGLAAKQAVYVGDMALDVATGHNAGVLTLAVPTGSSTKEEIRAAKPYKLANNLDNVGQIIESLASG